MLKMLIMGPAGAGKGTMSELIASNFKVAHISSGDMFREEIKHQTHLGLQAKSYITQGLLVPDEVTIQMVVNRLKKDDCQNGYLLDGFPRSLAQAEAIEDFNINAVINLQIDEHLLVDRIVFRRICQQCGTIYNIKLNPIENAEICPKCCGKLYQRNDDTYEKLMVRLESYREETKPVIDYYRQKGIVYDVDAGQTIDDVYKQIESILKNVAEEETK